MSINGSVLKWIAILTMFIDHVGGSILEVFVLNGFGTSPMPGILNNDQWYAVYAVDVVLRFIGRVSFPIFCFLLVEGFLHTHDVKKYAIRLGLFALLSEIPFNLAFRNQLLFWKHQNVYFTLLIGLLCMWGIKAVFASGKSKLVEIMGVGALLIVCGAAAELLNTDYGANGVLLIVLLYLLRSKRKLQCIAGAAAFAWEISAPLAFVPIFFYNGERGHQKKWLFYWFYPVHLLIFYVIGAWILPGILG